MPSNIEIKAVLHNRAAAETVAVRLSDAGPETICQEENPVSRRSLREIVYSHHEHHDGPGYPRGLRGTEIPLGARTVAVANTLDSITSNLPYRSARSLSEARREIQAWARRQFDPEVVGVFMKIPDLVFEDMRREIKADSGEARL
jgi:response regulator RpfG family c-di-GMP phosphodiesterase